MTASIDDVWIGTARGPMRAIVARPDGAGPHRAVVTFPHVGGLTDTMRLMAARVADGGYLCVVPDLYHRLGTIVVDPRSTDPEVVAIMKIAAGSIGDEGAMEDAAAVFSWLAVEPGVTGDRCGAIGFGRGGSLALRTAATYPQIIPAAASVLGFGVAAWGEAAATRLLAGITGSIYCAFAEDDNIIPPSEREALASVLGKLRIDAQVVVHAAARHPYVFPDRAVYDAAAAERDWAAIFAMFDRRLNA